MNWWNWTEKIVVVLVSLTTTSIVIILMFNVDVLFTITPIPEHQLEQKDYVIHCMAECTDEGICSCCVCFTCLVAREFNWNPLEAGKETKQREEQFIEFWEFKNHKVFSIFFRLFRNTNRVWTKNILFIYIFVSWSEKLNF